MHEVNSCVKDKASDSTNEGCSLNKCSCFYHHYFKILMSVLASHAVMVDPVRMVLIATPVTVQLDIQELTVSKVNTNFRGT